MSEFELTPCDDMTVKGRPAPIILKEWQEAANGLATEKGWWDQGGPTSEDTFGDECMRKILATAEEYEGFRNSPGEPVARSMGDMHMLLITEIVESYQEHLDGRSPTEVYYTDDKPGKPEGIPVELADLFIRLMDFCERVGIDLQDIARLKHEYNSGRSYRHGNKRA